MINRGVGQRDFASARIAVTRELSDRLSLGVEAGRSGPDAVGARAQTSLGAGAILRLSDHVNLLLAGGPIFEDGAGPTRYHAYAALGFQF